MRARWSLGLLAGCLVIVGAPSVAGDAEDPGPDLQRVEVPGAGLALLIPAHWNHAEVIMREAIELLPGSGEPALPTRVVTLLTWSFDPEDPVSCELARYEPSPLTLAEHADWYAEQLLADPGARGEVVSQALELPIGDAIRVDSGVAGEMARARYLFESAGTRYDFTCVAIVPPGDAWLELAWAIERLGEPVADVTSAVPLAPGSP